MASYKILYLIVICIVMIETIHQVPLTKATSEEPKSHDNSATEDATDEDAFKNENIPEGLGIEFNPDCLKMCEEDCGSSKGEAKTACDGLCKGLCKDIYILEKSGSVVDYVKRTIDGVPIKQMLANGSDHQNVAKLQAYQEEHAGKDAKKNPIN